MGYVKFSKLNTTYNIILLRIFFYLMYTVFNKKKQKRSHKNKKNSPWIILLLYYTWQINPFYMNFCSNVGYLKMPLLFKCVHLLYYYLIWFRDKRDRKWYVHKSKYDYKTFIIAHVIKKLFIIIHEDIQ